jgi:hypothetical protein
MPNKLQRLQDSVQSLVYRLQSLENSVDRCAEDSKEFPEQFGHIGRRLGDTLRGVFERWASLDLRNEGELVSHELQDLSRDLKQQFEALDTGPRQVTFSHQLPMKLYTVLGSARGLVQAMSETRNAMGEINWQQFAAARF